MRTLLRSATEPRETTNERILYTVKDIGVIHDKTNRAGGRIDEKDCKDYKGETLACGTLLIRIKTNDTKLDRNLEREIRENFNPQIDFICSFQFRFDLVFQSTDHGNFYQLSLWIVVYEGYTDFEREDMAFKSEIMHLEIAENEGRFTARTERNLERLERALPDPETVRKVFDRTSSMEVVDTAVTNLNSIASIVYELKEAGQFEGSEHGKPPKVELEESISDKPLVETITT